MSAIDEPSAFEQFERITARTRCLGSWKIFRLEDRVSLPGLIDISGLRRLRSTRPATRFFSYMNRTSDWLNDS